VPTDEERPPDRIAGLPLNDAVDAVVARSDSDPPEMVRRALSSVETDGVVTWDGVDAALAHLSKVVSTPETRAELAAIELDDAREAAEPVADVDVVRTRLAAFESRLDAVEARVDELGADLQSLVGDDSTGLYETAVEIHELTVAANRTQQAADELQVDLEAFQRWLADADERRASFEEELDALAESLADLSTTVDELAVAIEESDSTSGPAVAWFDALLRHRALAPLFADLQAELDSLRAWDERDGGDTADDLDALATRLDDLRDRWAASVDRLDGLARPAWHDRFDGRLSAFEAELDGVEPPVDWGAVSAALDDARAGLDDVRT
jgi:chromosome segregation ATPase